MRHRVFTGCFAALEARWLDDVARLQQDAPLRPVSVLIGSNILASYLKLRLAERGRAVANLRFHTFLDLARRIGHDRTSPVKPRLPALGGATILDDVLTETVPKVFAPVRGFSGFRENLLETFRDLRDAGISPRELEQKVRSARHVAPERMEHIKGLAQLYRKFQDRTGRFTDVDDDFRAAVAEAGRAQQSLGSGQLLVYGVYDVTGQQQELLSALKDSVELSYYIPYADAGVSSFAQPFVAHVAAELGTGPEPLPAPDRQDGLFLILSEAAQRRAATTSPQPAPVADDGSFALVSAPGDSRVAVEIVREILRAVRDGIVAGFYDIAVLLRHPREQIPILAEALRLRAIPYFVQGGTPFEDRPLCRSAVAIACLDENGFARDKVLQAMELVAASLPAGENREWAVQQWRALTNDAQFLAGVDAWDAGTESLVVRCLEELAAAQAAQHMGDENDKRVLSVPAARYRLSAAQLLRTAWLKLREAAAGWPASLGWLEWAQLLERRLEPLLQKADDWPTFSAVVDGIGALAGLQDGAREETRVPRNRLLHSLRESLRGRTLARGRFMRSGVNLLPIGMARGLRFPVVILGGLEEGSFPARPRQDPLLLDAEREAVGGLYSRLPLKAKRVEEDRLLFDMAMRAAEKRLVLLTSRLDESTDRERIPSEFFLRVAEAARGEPMTLRDLQEGKVPGFRSVALESPAPRAGQIATDAAEARLRMLTAERRESRHVLAALAREEPELLERCIAYDRSRWTPDLTVFDGRIFDEELVGYLARKAGPAAGQVSASRMEEYARCPYLFFLKRIMGLQEWEEPEPAQALDPLTRGSVVHSILERFVRENGGQWMIADAREKLQSTLARLAADELEKAHPAGIPPLLWELECEGLQKLLRSWLDFERARTDSGLRPCAVEHPFGTFPDEAPRPVLRIQAGRHLFEFRGRIDRVDLSPDGRRARVIDYKTGRLPGTMAKPDRPAIMAGEKIQIAVYRGALLSSGDWPLLEDIEGEYLHLQPQDNAIVPCAYDGTRLQEGMERLRTILEASGDGLCSGVFFARTAGTVYDANCTYCGYRIICGKDVARRDALKSRDPAVIRFAQACKTDLPSEVE